METSSPLAAMQPLSHTGQFGFGCRDRPEFDSRFFKQRTFDTKNFNFRDLSMTKSNQSRTKSDYFTWKPVRGSSPTASLAADLSQNFHIDQSRSPDLPTPRRSLFTNSGTFGLNTPRNVITPPIPSSSPGPDNDTMDLSPLLPHKPPHAAVLLTQATPPTSESVSSENETKSGMESDEALLDPLRRRKSSISRPSFRRGFSTTSATLEAHTLKHADPPFLFRTIPVSSQSLLETFIESPEQDKKLSPSYSTSALLGPCRSRPPLAQNGSPVNAIRRATAPATRAPRIGISRRTQSLYASNGVSVARQEKRCCTSIGLQSVADAEQNYTPTLPHFVPSDEPDGLPRITNDTLVNVLLGLHGEEASRSTIIDCRFEYEYNGGHIEGAVNYNDKEYLAKQLFETSIAEKKILIFHCEYSACRAPIMAKFIRQRDRAINDFQYPKLTYPEIYILDGGYSGFFKSHSMHCFPRNYVEMVDKEHAKACELGMARVRQKRKLSRSQTYAFGQGSCGAQEPFPTRSTFDSFDTMDVDSILPTERPFLLERRLGSY